MLAIFLIAYITLVFGIEMALRAYKSERFAPRGKWNTSICIAAVTFLILMTWIPTVAWPMPNRCFGSLIWYSVRYELIAIVIISILVFFFLLLAGLISFQLMRTPDVDANERIAASRMCYYLLMAALVYVSAIITTQRRPLMSKSGPRSASGNRDSSSGIQERTHYGSRRRSGSFRFWNHHWVFPPLPSSQCYSHGHQSDQQGPSSIPCHQEATTKTSIFWPKRSGDEHKRAARPARRAASR